MHPHHPKLVILGRDGVLNVYRDDHVKAPDEWQPVPGALEAVARLNQAGWHTVVATNQSGIGRGLIDMASLNSGAPAHDAVAGRKGRAHRRGVLLPAHAGRALRLPQAAAGPDAADRRALRPRRPARQRADGRRHRARPAGRASRRLRTAPGAHRPCRRTRRPSSSRNGSTVSRRAVVHDDLAAFAEFVLHREHTQLGVVGEDSRPTPLR